MSDQLKLNMPVNLRSKHILWLWVLPFLWQAYPAGAQVCECLNCPVALPPAGLDTCYEREFILNIKGASNDDLSDPFQGICAVNVHFQHNYVWSQEMFLISPGGDTLRLTGPALTSGYASSALSRWDITFIPNKFPGNPDPGFNEVWSNDQLWQVFQTYGGTYHTAEGDLDDFDSGPVNGQWKILLRNCAEIESGNFLNFSIVFCDETGIDCSCQAYGGKLTEAGPQYLCEGDPSLRLELEPFYLAGPPDSAIYDYKYLLSYEDIYVAIADTFDLRMAQPGKYEVCGLSYAKEDSLLLPVPDGGLTIPTLKSYLFSDAPPFCGDVSTGCAVIYIGARLPEYVIDTTLCSGLCVQVGDSSYCATTSVRDTFQAVNGCDSIVALNLTILPATHVFISDTICQGEFVIVGNNFYTQTGTYENLLANPSTGCDSLVTLQLFVASFNALINPVPVLNCFNQIININAQSSTFSVANPIISWTFTPGGNIISGANTLMPQVNQPGTYSLVLSSTFENGKYCADTASVTIQEDATIPELTGPNRVDYCAGGLVTAQQLGIQDLQMMGGTYSYFSQWPPNPAAQLTPPFDPATLDSLISVYQVGNCIDTLHTFFNPIARPFVEFLEPITICNDSLNGIFNTLINFDTLILNTNVLGSWANTDLAPVSGAFPQVDFQGVSGPTSYTFTWTSFNAMSPCQNISREVEIFVENCGCPSLAANIPDIICNESINISLEEAKITLESGQWNISDFPAGSTNPAEVFNDSLLLLQRDTGLYKLVFRLDNPPPPGCPDTAFFWIEIVSPPFALLTQVDTVCNDYGSGLYPVVFDLQTLIVEGDSTGYWEEVTPLLNPVAGSSVNFINQPSGSYIFEYTTGNASGGCAEVIYTSEITVLDCACPEFTISHADTLCNDLDSQLLQNYQLTGGFGTWAILENPAGSQPAYIVFPDTFILNLADPGNYKLEFEIANSPGGSCRVKDTLDLLITASPDLIVQTMDTVCNGGIAPAFPFVLDFSTLLNGADTMGFWVDISASGAAGTLPLLNFTGIVPGSYTFDFNSLGAVAPCTKKTHQVVVEVLDCSCPPFFDGSSCNDAGSFNLNSLNPTGLPVNWFVRSSPMGGNPVSIQGSALNIFGKDPGIYELLVTWLPPPNSICPDSVFVTFELSVPDPLVISTDASVCNNSGPNADPLLNFDSLFILSNGMGQWSDLNQSGASGSFPLLNFTGVAPGTYWFLYTQFGVSPCLDQVDSIMITVSDCACPQYDFLNPISWCLGSEPLFLGGLNLNAPSGMWSIESLIPGFFPGQIMNDTLFTDQADPGQYQLIYEWDDPNYPNCPDTIHIALTLEQPHTAGTTGDTLVICAGAFIDTLGFNFLVDADTGGLWFPSILNPGLIQGLDISTGQLTGNAPEIAGLYAIYYTTMGGTTCPPDTSLIFMRVHPVPAVSLGPDRPLGCQTDSLLLEVDLNGSSVKYNLAWYSNQMLLGENEILVVYTSGLYTLEATNPLTGCTGRDSILVYPSDPGPDGFVLEVNFPICNQSNGLIEISDVVGGQGPFIYRLNQGPWQTSTQWNNLSAGTYLIEIEDVQGCRTDSLIQLTSENTFSVSLGNDLQVSPGTEVPLVANLSGNVGVVTLVEWNPGVIVCPACLEQTFLVKAPSIYMVSVTNSNGCTATDQIYIDVLAESLRFYVPDGFSPNKDGINDQFTIFGNDQLKLIQRLEIFDRWGNALFSGENILPNEISQGWDGTYQGRDMDPGVYVYQARLELANGATRWIKGEVILIR